MPLQFKPASALDHAALLALIAAYYAHDHIALDADDAALALGELLTNPALGRAWLFDLNGETAGYMIFTFAFDIEFGGRTGMLTDLYVHERFRGQNVGAAAIKFLDDFCRAEGIRAYELHPEKSNLSAQRFYARNGMAKQDRILMIRHVGREA